MSLPIEQVVAQLNRARTTTTCKPPCRRVPTTLSSTAPIQLPTGVAIEARLRSRSSGSRFSDLDATFRLESSFTYDNRLVQTWHYWRGGHVRGSTSSEFVMVSSSKNRRTSMDERIRKQEIVLETCWFLSNVKDMKSEDEFWDAVTTRDTSADGIFFYAVRTTGIYCRPSCPSRAARRENVSFFESPAAAEEAGFRACRRCHPSSASLDEQRTALVEQACRLIEESEGAVTLREIARRTFMSQYHFHRIFEQITGVTPKAYGAKFGRRVPDVSPSEDIRFGIGESSLGPILVAATTRGLCAILMDDSADALLDDLQSRFPDAEFIGGDEQFETWMTRVIGFVDNPSLGLELPLDIRGTAFQQRVWKALQQVPVGSTVSYADVAERLGKPSAVRAVAGACAANALAVAIPCHRVVKTDGSISGYRWGVDRKRALLRREGALSS
jgi:AraC family transcriptional regulator, regulatory protein of adaptative response / methylated-DNA-[protein]-cysteine methyltransferase